MTGVVGEWLLPTAMLPYFVATGLQDTYLRLGLLIASALAAAHIVLLGVVLYLARQRKVRRNKRGSSRKGEQQRAAR